METKAAIGTIRNFRPIGIDYRNDTASPDISNRAIVALLRVFGVTLAVKVELG